MADTTPVSNNLVIRLANMLDDALLIGGDNGITASTDGLVFTATVKNQRLNEGYRWLCNELLARLSKDDVYRRAQGLIATQAITFASAGVTVNMDYISLFRLVDSAGVPYQFGSKADFDSDKQFFINNAYSVESGKIYAYTRTAGVLTLLDAGTATFYYFKADRIVPTTGVDVDVNTAPDTTLDQQWLDPVMLYAAWRLAKDKSSAEWIDKAAQFLEQAYSKLPGGGK